MRLKGWLAALILVGILTLFFFAISECGRRLITGQVIDAESGEPIEGAAVLIDWWESGPGPPGLAGSHQVEWRETITDAQGHFAIPKYSTIAAGKEFNMAVYKKGYVCWSSEKLFPSWEQRINFHLKDRMKIRLEPFKEGYSREDHAKFTIRMKPSVASRVYYEAIKSESDLYDEMIYKKREK